MARQMLSGTWGNKDTARPKLEECVCVCVVCLRVSVFVERGCLGQEHVYSLPRRRAGLLSETGIQSSE